MACTMEDLIQRVREKPILWDLNHMYFRDVGRKRDTWDVVAEECGLYDGEEARQAWAKLRNSHREAMRRRLEDNKMKPWKFEGQMEFLLANSCCDIRKSTKTDTTDNETEEKVLAEPLHVELDMDDDVNSPENETNTIPAVADSKKDKNLKASRKTIAKRERDSNSHNSSTETDFTSETIKIKRPTNDERVSDGLTELFTGLCEKTRNLPRHLQLRVQREIFDSVTKAEEEALKSTSSRTPIRKNVIIPKRKTHSSKKARKVSGHIPENVYGSSSHGHSVDMNVNDSNSSQIESPVDPIGNIVIKTDPIEIGLESDLSL